MSNKGVKIAYQETSDEAFLCDYVPQKDVFSQPLSGVQLTDGLSPADIDTENANPVTTSKIAMAHFLEGFFGKAESNKKKTFWDDVPVFSNKGGPSETQKGPPTMFAPGYDIGGGV